MCMMIYDVVNDIVSNVVSMLSIHSDKSIVHSFISKKKIFLLLVSI